MIAFNISVICDTILASIKTSNQTQYKRLLENERGTSSNMKTSFTVGLG